MNAHSLELPSGGLSDGAVAVRPYRADDAGPLLAGVRDRDVVRFANVRWSSVTEEELVERMAEWAQRARDGVSLNASIRDAASDALLGHLVVFGVDRANGRGEIGFWLLPAARGRGATARAVTLVADWLFSDVGLERVQAVTDVANVASQRTLERAGFAREGILRGYFPRPGGGRLDYISYSRLASDTESSQIANA